jgi:hypothetical protein
LRLRLGRRLGDELFQSCFDAGGLEAEWTGCGFVGDAAVCVHDVEAIGPAGVSTVGRIVERVHNGGELDSELQNAELAERAAFIEVFWAGEDDVIVKIV